MSRLTDYGVIVMSYMAADPEATHNAAEVAAGTFLRPPTVSKLMRLLAKRGLLESQRGVKGGYRLARPPREISLARIIDALEGPVGITVCTGPVRSDCIHESVCPSRGHWQRINRTLRQALETVNLSEMVDARGQRGLNVAAGQN
jgi:FeS assembly SUF system regulator